MSAPKTLNNAETALLGLLSEHDAHAYGLRKEVYEHSMDYWTELSKSSIYKTLKLLEHKGYVEGESSLGEKNVGRRTYRITGTGHSALLETLRTFLSTPEKEIWRLDLATANLGLIPRDELPGLLDSYERELQELIEGYRRLESWLIGENCPPGNLALARRPLALYQAELAWLKDFRLTLGVTAEDPCLCETAVEPVKNAILWKSRDPYHGHGAEGLKSVLRERLQGRVLEAWIFGSHSTGTVSPDSDLDLILVMDTDIPFTRRAALFDDVYDLVPALDLLVYTPEEFQRLLNDNKSGFWRSVAATKMRLL